jgi:transposase
VAYASPGTKGLNHALPVHPLPAVPAETARVAHPAWRPGPPWLPGRDALPDLDDDPAFADLYPASGPPASAPWRLALGSGWQFAEPWSAHQAAEAGRSRLEWT